MGEFSCIFLACAAPFGENESEEGHRLTIAVN